MPSPRDEQIRDPRPLTELRPERLATLRVIATDVDGTLTRAGKLGSDLLEALAQLSAAGFRVIPISGRPAGEVMGLCRYLPGVSFGVAENGLLEIEPDHAPRWLGEVPDVERLRVVGEHMNQAHGAGLRLTGDAFCRLGDVAYERDGRDETELLRLRELAEAEGVHLIWSNVHVHLAAQRPDKGAGLLRLLNQRGIDPLSVVTVGDAPNDGGLFEADRFGLTVGTADVVAQRRWFSALPEFTTAEREVDGFLALSGWLCGRG
ncbi:haloacid dehalogenase-like hydrolase [Enhygromyxa salina]|uniref:Haloacid dehalogenase-like hydrolase n=1 Tax=Enhygromyxa salina TaxID=215803 RepID=A0A0C2CYV4_9BACT|nr:HAD hydrolase family protein [Enhygromyxa salina]KIG16146.1 haloacid dehalogenase-like hydrolase [Enhygromyxa salina]